MDFRKKLFVILVIMTIGSTAKAQWLDTLKMDINGKKFPTASFDSRNSFISDRRAHIWGIKAGVEFSSRLQIGMGYNFHDKRLTKTVFYLNSSGNPVTTEAVLHLAYVSLYTRYVYYKTEKWKFSIMPLQLGFGNSKYVYQNEFGSQKTGKGGIVSFEPGISVSYKFIPWLGVGADFGYRYMIKANPHIPENFNSPIYSLYLVIYWGEIYKTLFPDTKLAQIL